MTQAEALSILKLGHTTFLTGAPGSGKSFVLRQHIEYLSAHGIIFAATASTGIAATHIQGMTIHSWSGLGVKEKLSDWDIELLQEKKVLRTRYRETRVLIIDEISMLHADFLDMLDRLARAFREIDAPFGGMQVVFCGDFFQLPPIVKTALTANVFAYSARSWRESKPVVCYLTEQHRQEDDTLTSVLKRIRTGDIDEGVWEDLARANEKRLEGEYTKLYTHNVDVQTINNKAFDEISGEERVYYMESKGKEALIETLKRNCLAEEELRLKVGAKVMCIKNDPMRRFMNGSLGRVAGFSGEEPIIDLDAGGQVRIELDSWRVEEDGKVKAEIFQFPLKLAWAITVHKSQGMTLDSAEIDLSKAFTYGMGYVALSRLRSIEGLYLVGMNPQALAVDEQVREQDSRFQLSSDYACDALLKYSQSELTKLHEDFILRSGGSVEKLTKAEQQKVVKIDTLTETLRLLKEKKKLKEIARERKLSEDTIVDHIEKLVEAGGFVPYTHVLPSKKICAEIQKAFKKEGGDKLKPVFDALKGKYTYLTLRLVRLQLEK
jgi:ATP-dependent DNA helicase PIF1